MCFLFMAPGLGFEMMRRGSRAEPAMPFSGSELSDRGGKSQRILGLILCMIMFVLCREFVIFGLLRAG